MAYTCKNKKSFENLAKKYGVRYRGQSKREIADSLVGFRQKYVNLKEKEMIFPFASENKKKRILKKQ